MDTSIIVALSAAISPLCAPSSPLEWSSPSFKRNFSTHFFLSNKLSLRFLPQFLLRLLGVWILKGEHVNIPLQPAACQSQRRCQRRASSGSAELGCVFASTRQKIHVITSEAQEAVPPDRTACVGSTLSGLRWLIPHSTRGCVCECVCRCERVRTRVYACKCRQQAHWYLALRHQSHPDLLAIPVLCYPNSEEKWALEGPQNSLTRWLSWHLPWSWRDHHAVGHTVTAQK